MAVLDFAVLRDNNRSFDFSVTAAKQSDLTLHSSIERFAWVVTVLPMRAPPSGRLSL